MRLATLRDGSPDGTLAVVALDGARFLRAGTLVPNLQAALSDWDFALPVLQHCAEALANDSVDAEQLDPRRLAAPMPRGMQFLDASAFPSHGALMQRAFDLPPIATDRPLMYQGMSHHFLGPYDPVPFVSAEDGIDFEGEFAVFLDDVSMGVSPARALSHVKLIGLLNDWSLRRIAPIEMQTGFGWIRAKPASSFAPFVVTPDQLGAAWHDGIVDLVLEAWRGDQCIGKVRGHEMRPNFAELIAHAAATRTLCAGTILGSGTVSVSTTATDGSCCLAERRGFEIVNEGAAKTKFLAPGESVRMFAHGPQDSRSIFGAIEQTVVLVKAGEA